MISEWSSADSTAGMDTEYRKQGTGPAAAVRSVCRWPMVHDGSMAMDADQHQDFHAAAEDLRSAIRTQWGWGAAQTGTVALGHSARAHDAAAHLNSGPLSPGDVRHDDAGARHPRRHQRRARAAHPCTVWPLTCGPSRRASLPPGTRGHARSPPRQCPSNADSPHARVAHTVTQEVPGTLRPTPPSNRLYLPLFHLSRLSTTRLHLCIYNGHLPRHFHSHGPGRRREHRPGQGAGSHRPGACRIAALRPVHGR